MKKVLHTSIIISYFIGIIVFSGVSYAQTTGSNGVVTGSNIGNTPCSSNSNAICNPLKATSVTAVLTDVVNIAIPIGAVIAVIMFVYVGFKFIFAQGKPEKINDAWKWFAYVAIGTAILLGAKVIITIMESTLTSAGVVQPGILPTS